MFERIRSVCGRICRLLCRLCGREGRCCRCRPRRRTVLLLGYWPPTDMGIASRRGMLWKWRTLQRNYEGSGYDVLAISPTFADTLGTRGRSPYWGKGTGELTVDYRRTSADFWRIVERHEPIAVMSFSRGKLDKSWEIESRARNLAQSTWVVALDYTDKSGVTQTQTWSAPHAGGSAADASPSQGPPGVGGPPDSSLAADATRDSNLPMPAIEGAVSAAFPNPPGDVVPWTDPSGDVGSFVSEYMAYHVAWYRDQSSDPDKCLFAGHVHVGVLVDAADGEAAVELQLAELFKVLP